MLLKATMLRAVNEAMFFVQPAVLSCLVVVTYHMLGNVLKPREVGRYMPCGVVGALLILPPPNPFL